MNDSFRFLGVRNAQVSVNAVSTVYDDKTALIYYLSTVDHQATSKSIWATGMANTKKKSGLSHGGYFFDYKFARPMETIKTPIGGSQYQNWATISKHQGLVLVEDMRAVPLTGYSVRKELKEEVMPIFYARLVNTLNRISDVPVLPEWGEAIWQAERVNEKSHVELGCTGGAVIAWLLKEDYPWNQTISDLIKTGKITVPPYQK